MSKDLRTSQRINLEAPVKLMFENNDVIECQSFNFSDKGLYVSLSSKQLADMTMGMELRVQFQGLNYTPPIATAVLVRLDSLGAGFRVTSIQMADE